ncbi:MAG TPA: M23 family metallopeptidase [Chitinispirillaceae bacterium]|nr:M23 family metallopeptidase [Chitinispirillaceae bacterium]
MKYSLPIDLGTGLEPTESSIAKYYKHNEVENKGGYFPIGGNTVWHGGIHLKPDQDAEIFAPFPGKVIAAHLPQESSKAIGNYGSANFILLEHEYNSNKFFSLYMHLKNLPLRADNEHIKKFAWLGTGESLKETLDKLSTGKILKCNVNIQAGDPLWITGEYGSSRHRTKLLHWEIFAEKNIFETPKLPDTPTSLAGATGWTAAKALLVKKVHPAPANVCVADKVYFRVSELNYKDAPANECSKINWLVKSADGSFNQTYEKKGISLEFTVPETLAGKTIKVFPYVNSASNTLFAQTVIQSGKRPETITIEDSDNNYNVDNETILKMFPAEMLGTDKLLTTDELIKFYKDNPSGNAVKMRNAQCKFIAEWGIPDINVAIKALKNKGWFLSANDIKPYVWWKDAVDVGVSLPADPHVWHFHPLKVVENFMAAGGAVSGTNENAGVVFYVKRDGVEVIVEKISDLLDNDYKHNAGGGYHSC